MKHLFLAIVALLAVINVTAQQNTNPCLTDHVTDEFFKNNPAQGEQLKTQFFNQYQQTLQTTGISKKSGAKRIIPVVFHVIHMYGPENISKEQILDQLRILNEDFNRLNPDRFNTRTIFEGDAADCEIEFRLATKDPNGNCTDGITRTYSTKTEETRDEIKTLIRWDNTKYLNIWVVKSIRSQSSDVGTTLGFAYLPWSLPGSKNVDGVVVRADYVGTIGTSNPARAGRTLTHEVGHYLGLLHPFENGCGSNCSSSGDRICDTPPVSTPSFGCDKNRNSCSNDSPNEFDQVENFMDYADGDCQNMFTWGQKTVMDMVLNNASYRSNLVSTSNLIATGTDIITSPVCAPKADFTSVTSTICAGKSVQFADVSWNGKVTGRTWTFTGGSPSSSTDSAVTVAYNNPGSYNVTLQVSNSAGQSQVTRTQIVVVLPDIANRKSPLVEGFEDATFPSAEWAVSGNAGTKTWVRTTVAAASGSASIRAVINASTATDEMYSLTLPAVDLGTVAPAYLKFKVAYAQRPNITTERLRVLYSTDCGNNWSLLTQRTGSNLTSAPNYGGTSFVPASASEWREISLSLASISNSLRGNIIFKFEAYSNGGNSIYLDDINLYSEGTTAVEEIFSKEELGISIQPNPSSDNATLSFALPNESGVDMKVFDITGRMVKDFGTATLQAGDHKFMLSKFDNNLTDGIYFVKLLVNNTLYTEKLVFVR